MKICSACGAPQDDGDDVTYTSAEVREIIEQMTSAYKRYVNKRIADHVATEQKAKAAADHIADTSKMVPPLVVAYTAPPTNPAEKT